MASMIDSLLENQKQLQKEAKEWKKQKKKREKAVSLPAKNSHVNPKKKTKSVTTKVPKSPKSRPSSLEQHFQDSSSYLTTPEKSVATGSTAPLSPGSSAISTRRKVKREGAWELRESRKYEPSPSKTPRSSSTVRTRTPRQSVSSPDNGSSNDRIPSLFDIQPAFDTPTKLTKKTKPLSSSNHSNGAVVSKRKLKSSAGSSSSPSAVDTSDKHLSTTTRRREAQAGADDDTPMTPFQKWKARASIESSSSELPSAFASLASPTTRSSSPKSPRSKKRLSVPRSSTEATGDVGSPMTPRTLKKWKAREPADASELPSGFASLASPTKSSSPKSPKSPRSKKKLSVDRKGSAAVDDIGADPITPRTLKKWKARTDIDASQLPPAFAAASPTRSPTTSPKVSSSKSKKLALLKDGGGVKKTIKKLKDVDPVSPKRPERSLSSTRGRKKSLSPERARRSSSKVKPRSKSVGKMSRQPSLEEKSAAADALRNRLANRFKEISEIRDSKSVDQDSISTMSSNSGSTASTSKTPLQSPSPSPLQSKTKKLKKASSVKSMDSKASKGSTKSSTSTGSTKSSSSTASKSTAKPATNVRKPRSLAQPDRLAPWQIREQQKHRITPMMGTGGLYGMSRHDDEEDVDDDDMGAKFSLPAGLGATTKKPTTTTTTTTTKKPAATKKTKVASHKKSKVAPTTATRPKVSAPLVHEKKANMIANPRGTQRDGTYVGKKERKKIKDARDNVKGSILSSLDSFV